MLVYQALIVSLFNRSELDCLFVRPWTSWGCRAGGENRLPSFILPVIRTQACHALVVVMAVVDCSKTSNYVAGIIFATMLMMFKLIPVPVLELELESTKHFELNPPLVIAFFAP